MTLKQFDNLFGGVLETTKKLGHDFEHRDHTPYKIKSKTLQVILYYSYITTMLIAIHTIVNKTDKLIVSTQSIGYVCTFIFGIYRNFYFTRYRKNIQNLIDSLKDLSNQANPSESDVLEKRDKHITKMATYYGRFLFCAIATTFFGTILRMIRTRSRLMITDFSYFFNIYQPYVFEIFFLTSIIAFTNACLTSMGIDGLFLSMCSNVAGHFEILQMKIRLLDYKSSNIHEMFNRLIKYHKHVLDLMSELTDNFKTILIILYLYSSMLICVMGFVVLTELNRGHPPFLPLYYVFAALFHKFCYDFMGSDIQTQSDLLLNAVYESDWPSMPKSMKMKFLILMLKSSDSVILKAGFYETNLPNFTDTVNTAYTYIAVLQNFL